MKIYLAKNSGFCFGVRRAVEMAEACAKESGTVYTYGNIIHNDAVVRELAEKGVHSVENLDSLHTGDTLIIRAHGAPPSVYEESERANIRLIDATCPYVKRIHKIVQQATQEGNTVLIAGKANHPMPPSKWMLRIWDAWCLGGSGATREAGSLKANLTASKDNSPSLR